MQETQSTELTNDEIVRRRDDAIRRALNTPPTPRKDDTVRKQPSRRIEQPKQTP
jgi:hypothetical protein